MLDRTCVADGCEEPPRSGSADLCSMHYHRMYRHGNLNTTAHYSGITVSPGRRYTSTYAPRHPLASKSGQVYDHRLVLFDAIGYGPHQCHWCGRSIDWLPRGHTDELQVDHLNGDGADNDLSNLVPSCRTCNPLRGQQAVAAARRQAGWWSSHDTLASLTKYKRRPAVSDGDVDRS